MFIQLAVASMVAADPAIVDVNRAMLASMHSARTIRQDRWHLRVNKGERNLLFEGQEADDGQHDNVAK